MYHLRVTVSDVCLAGFRLINTKCMSDIELWKKILHPNLVHLREVFTTKAFGDNCMCGPLIASVFYECNLVEVEGRSVMQPSPPLHGGWLES